MLYFILTSKIIKQEENSLDMCQGNKVFLKIILFILEEDWNNVSEELKDFVTSCLKFDPEERHSAM